MAYTRAQAREYYLNYTKKGKKKGRKKGKKKKSGISKELRAQCTAECKEVRERIKAEKKEFMRQYREAVKNMISSLREEMKARLKVMPKGPEKDALREEYQNRINAIKELKKQQTEQFNEYFTRYKEKSVNDIRAKYGLKPLAPSKPKTSTSQQKKEEPPAQLSEEQKGALAGALDEVKKK